MDVKVDTRPAERAFKKAVKDPRMKALAAAAFKYATTSGLAAHHAAMQGVWPKNSPEWAQRKGAGKKTWERTGKTLAAVTANPPGDKLGTKRGLRTGLNARSMVAFAVPMAFTDSKGRKLPRTRQEQVYQALRAGSGKARLKQYAKRKGRSFEDVLKDVASGKKKGPAIPARPWIQWQAAWIDDVVKDVEAAAGKIFAAEGFDVKA